MGQADVQRNLSLSAPPTPTFRFPRAPSWAMATAPALFLIGATSVGRACGQSACLTDDPELVFHLPFDADQGTTVSDVSGNGHDGIGQNGSAWTSQGETAGGFNLEGVADYIDMNFVPVAGSAPRTVAMWIHPLTANQGSSTLIEWGSSSNGKNDRTPYLRGKDYSYRHSIKYRVLLFSDTQVRDFTGHDRHFGYNYVLERWYVSLCKKESSDRFHNPWPDI